MSSTESFWVDGAGVGMGVDVDVWSRCDKVAVLCDDVGWLLLSYVTEMDGTTSQSVAP